MLFALTAFAQQSPIQINVTDRNVSEVYLVCPGRTISAKVQNGIASFDEVVNNCQIELRARIGTLAKPGGFTCSLNAGCQEKGVIHRAVSDAAGRLNMILADNSADMFELKCGNDRKRSKVTENVAVFEGVPNSGGCTAFFKGGAPVKVTGLGPGTYQCDAIAGVASCKQRSSYTPPPPPPEPVETPDP